MEEKDNIRNEIEELAPGFPAKPAIAPPDGYFALTPDRILARWSKTTVKKHRHVVLQRWMIAAATVGIVIATWCWLIQPVSNTSVPSITRADAFAYIEENLDEFDDILQEQAYEWTTQEPILLPDTDVEEYLLEELDEHELEQLF